VTLRIVRLGDPCHAKERIRNRYGGASAAWRSKGTLCAQRLVRCLVSRSRAQRETNGAGKVAVTETEWARFVRAFKAKMNLPAARRTLDLLTVLSRGVNFSIGCYCARCHRSVLRVLLKDRSASLR
jgi:hypothetical protein